MEDAAQVLNLPPAAKYAVSSEEVVLALAGLCKAKVIAVRNLYLQFVFAWLTGNGDLHAKNASVLEGQYGWAVAPVYDIPCTLLYGDDTMALTIAGRVKNLKARHWQDFAASIGLPERAATAANKVALTAAAGIDLEALPFTGSPLNGALRELRFRAPSSRADPDCEVTGRAHDYPNLIELLSGNTVEATRPNCRWGLRSRSHSRPFYISE